MAYQQVLAEDRSVFSIQWITIPHEHSTGLTSEKLLSDYLSYIEKVTLRLIKTRMNAEGVTMRLSPAGPDLISLAHPVTVRSENGTRTTLRICGGFLVQPGECNVGQLDFLTESVPSGTRVALRLADYCPLLLGSRKPSLFRRWLYRLTQALIHKVVAVRFLAMIYRTSTGKGLKKGAVKVAIRSGDPT
ncbi:MAG: hypothetical protein HXX17_12255 [Geobacteraceae bacterium]|nr:hypothetical protein [Geobacteraceae bacterium]